MNWNLTSEPAWAEWLIRVSVQASVLALMVYLAIGLLRRWITPAWRFALWGLVMLRLALPVSWESPLSLYNFWLKAEARTLPVFQEDPVIDSAVASEGQQPAETSPSETANEPLSSNRAVQRSATNEDPPLRLRLGIWESVATLWLGILFVLATWHLIRFVRFLRRIRTDLRRCDHPIDVELRRAADAMGIRRQVRLVETPAVSSAALYGFWRPWILVPQGFVKELDPEARQWVFLHELAHLKRCDTLLLWLIQGLCVAHWFNPVVWWVSRKMGEVRELACDALVLSSLDPESRERYGLTVVKLASKEVLPIHVPGMLSHSQKKRNLERRIHMIANYHKSRFGLVVATTVFAMLTLTGLTDGVTEAADADVATGEGQPTTPESVGDAVQALAALGAQVEYAGGDTNGIPVSVHLDESGITDSDLAPLASLPTLTNLWLRGFSRSVVSDETLSYISGLTNLRALQFYGTVRFTPDGLAQLKDLDQLGKFNLGTSEIPDAGLEVLSELDNLRFFWMAGTGARYWGDRITDIGCDKLAALKQLTGLGLLNTGISSKGVLSLSNLTNLTWVNLGANPLITDDAAPAFGRWTKLDTLWLFDVSIGDACLEQIGKMKDLEVLDLAGTRISDRGLKHLSNLGKLKSLTLGGSHTPNLSLGYTDIGDQGLESLENLPSLTSISLTRTKVTDAGLRHLARFPSLKTIWLDYTDVTGNRLSDLASLTNLTSLDLEASKVTDDGLKNLSHLKSLTGIGLVGTAITDGGLQHLKAHESLRGVNLKGSKVTAEGVEALRSARTNLFVNWP